MKFVFIPDTFAVELAQSTNYLTLHVTLCLNEIIGKNEIE